MVRVMRVENRKVSCTLSPCPKQNTLPQNG